MSGMHQPVNGSPQLELFNDVEDHDVRARNRAIAMYNLANEHTQRGLITQTGMVAMLTYLDAVPPKERADVVARLSLMMEETPEQ